MTHLGKAPLTVVRLADGSRANVHRGGVVPSTADPKDVARLVEEGYLAKATPEPAPEPDESAGKPATIDEVMTEVGDDPEKARAALEVEQARGEAARSTLIGKLEAVIAAGDSEDDES